MLDRLDRWLGSIERASALAAGLTIFALMLLGIFQVLGRQIVNAPVFGYIDLVETTMIVFALLPIAYCERLGAHVRMEIFTRLLTGRVRWTFEAITTLAALFITIVIGWYAYTHGLRAFDNGDTTIDAEIITWPSKMVVPLALALLAMRLGVQLAGYLRLIRDPEAELIAVPQRFDGPPDMHSR